MSPGSDAVLSKCTQNLCVIPAAHIPLFLYPFLNTVTKTKAFEYLRLTSLGVIGALVKVRCFFVSAILTDQRLQPDNMLHGVGTFRQIDDANVISFLLTTEIIPLCLRIMESGSELSKTVSVI